MSLLCCSSSANPSTASHPSVSIVSIRLLIDLRIPRRVTRYHTPTSSQHTGRGPTGTLQYINEELLQHV